MFIVYPDTKSHWGWTVVEYERYTLASIINNSEIGDRIVLVRENREGILFEDNIILEVD